MLKSLDAIASITLLIRKVSAAMHIQNKFELTGIQAIKAFDRGIIDESNLVQRLKDVEFRVIENAKPDDAMKARFKRQMDADLTPTWHLIRCYQTKNDMFFSCTFAIKELNGEWTIVHREFTL